MCAAVCVLCFGLVNWSLIVRISLLRLVIADGTDTFDNGAFAAPLTTSKTCKSGKY